MDESSKGAKLKPAVDLESDSKDGGEVRARVTLDQFSALKAIADGRGEKLPVIVREACAEYLARRAAGAAGKYPAPGAAALLQTLQDQPEVAETLIALGRLLSAPAKPAAASAAAYGKQKKPGKPSK